MSLRDNWKQTGTGLGHAFRDLGKSIVKSATTVARKAENWADSGEIAPATDTVEAEVVTEAVEAEVVQEEKSED